MQKAQASAFIIVGVLLIAVAGMFLFMTKGKEPIEEQPASYEATTVDNYIQLCLDETAEAAVLGLGLQGWHYAPPITSMSTKYSEVPFYYYKGDVTNVLTPSQIIDEMKSYMDTYVPLCLGDFSEFPEYQITVTELDNQVMIGDKKTMIRLNMPTKIRQGSEVVQREYYETEVDVRLRDMYDAASMMVTKTTQDPQNIDLTFITRLQDDYSVKIDSMTYKNTILYLMTDPSSTIDDVPVTMLFAMNVDEANYLPVIDVPDELYATKDMRFTYRISAEDREGDKLEYAVATDLFDVNPVTGEIDFTPHALGEHDIVIKVFDGKGISMKATKLIVEAAQ